MKTYYLVFDGDPNLCLEVLRKLGPISVVQVGRTLHCISFDSPHFEQMILNTLIPHANADRDVFMIPAQLPLHPAPKKAIQLKIAQMIDEGKDDSGFAL